MPVGAGVPVIPQAQLDLGPAGWWRPEAEDPAGNQVRVKAGYAFAGASAVVDQPADQLTAGFASVSSGAGFKRYDMVYIDDSGVVQIAQGRDVPLANPLFDGAPGRPNGPPMPVGNPCAFVFIDEIGAVTVNIADVFQINGFVPLQRDLDGVVLDKGFYGGAPVGLTLDVSAMFAAETRLPPGTGAAVPNSGGTATQAGVVTSPPLNYTWLTDQNGDQIKHSTGAECFGRLTEAAGTWTLAFHYIDAAGVEQTMDPSTDAEAAPTDLRLVGVAKVFSRHDPNRPLFDSAVSRLSDQIVGDIPYATETQPGKVQLAGDGDTAAGEAVQGNDSRLAAATAGQSGRANAGAVLGPEPVTRLIQGAGISVALLQAGGELQFTITNTSPGIPIAPGGFSFSWAGLGSSGALPFTPIGAMATGNTDGLFTAQVGGAIGTIATQQVWAAFNSVAPGTNAGTGGILAGSPVTAFGPAGLTINGGGGTCIIWGL